MQGDLLSVFIKFKNFVLIAAVLFVCFVCESDDVSPAAASTDVLK